MPPHVSKQSNFLGKTKLTNSLEKPQHELCLPQAQVVYLEMVENLCQWPAVGFASGNNEGLRETKLIGSLGPVIKCLLLLQQNLGILNLI